MEIKKKFYDLINAANANNNNVNIYMFIKDCAFRFVFEHMNSIDENNKINIQSLYYNFQKECQQNNWNFYNFNPNEYLNFIENFYKKINFDSCQISMLHATRSLTEILSYINKLDNLAMQRIEYLNKKIESKQENNNNNNNHNYNQQNSNYYNQNQQNNNNNNNHNFNNQNSNNFNNNNFNNNNFNNNNNNFNNNNYNNNNNNYNNNNFNNNNNYNNNNFNNNNNYNNNNNNFNNNNNYNNNNNINNNMNFSPSNIQPNTQIGQYYQYNPRNVPKLVNLNLFHFPISKRDPNYLNLKEIIFQHIEYANLEFDYHKIDKGREHLEAAVYYLNNITE